MIATTTQSPATPAGLANLLNPAPRLLGLLGESVREGHWLDAYLFAAGIEQILDDWVHRDPGQLGRASRALRRRRHPGARLAAAGTTAAADLAWSGVTRSPSMVALRAAQRTAAELAWGLAEMVMESSPAPAPERALLPGPDRVQARLRLQLDRLPDGVRRDPLRLPACFRTFDLTPADVSRLARLIVDRWPDRPLLVAGVRTSGCYLGPLLAAALQAGHRRRVQALTMRPGQRWLREEVRSLRHAAAAGATVLVVDDPPRSWGSVAAASRAIGRLGFPAERVAIVAPVLPSTAPVPDRLAGHPRVLLPWREWAVHSSLAPDAVREALAAVLSPGSDVRAVRRLQLEPDMAGDRGHARALYDVEIDRDGGHERRRVYVKGVGLGYFGRHAAAVAEAVSDFVPEVYGVRDGLLFRAWCPAGGRVRPDMCGPGLADRIAAYVWTRATALRVPSDPTFLVAARGSAPESAALLLSRAMGGGDLLLRPLTERLVARLLRPARPVVLDGHTGLDAWFGDSSGARALRKIGFEERAFSSLDLTCFDPLFDLAGAAASTEAPGFGDGLRAAYGRLSGASVKAEPWLLYQLVHLEDEKRRAPDAGAEIERRMARRVQRYLEERVLVNAEPVALGALCALDLDGVLEGSELGFSAAGPRGALALRALLRHGLRPVLATGRSLSEVRDRCDAYHLPGGVAEYGAVIYVREEGCVTVLLDDGERAALEGVRDRLREVPGIRLDPEYRHSVRASLSEGGRNAGALPPRLIERALATDAAGLRVMRGESQTDFVPARATKASGLVALKEALGTPEASFALAIGDTESDLEMLSLAEHAFAPSNAAPAMRRAGITVLRRPAQRAVEEAVTRLVGHRPGTCPACRVPDQDPTARLLLQTLDLLGMTRAGKLAQLPRLWRALATAAPSVEPEGPGRDSREPAPP